MSKMDGLRAMREARYEAAQAGKKTAAPKPKAKPASTKAAPVTPETSGEQLCGHKAISGRTCTREQGHAAKSHRYA
jgi:hypothetical protein